MARKLIIIGRGRGAEKGLRSYGEKWSVCIPRKGATRMFSMHPNSDIRSRGRQIQAISDGIEVINPENYPLQNIVNQFSSKYFPESISYMIALGLYEGYKIIDLVGCNADPSQDDHIVKKRPGVDYWIGRAQGMGVQILIDGQECMFEPREGLYGY